VLPYDAASLDTIEATVRSAMELANNKPIDMLFLNSGRYQLNPALQTPIEETRAILRVNFEAPVELAQTLIQLDSWRERGHGHIVVTASLVAKGAHSLSSSYSASKQALRGYFQTLSTEEFRWLRVDVVCPGAIATDMWNALDEKLIADEGEKMSSARFVRLMLTGVIGPQILFYETWISKAPGLLWITLSSFAPHLFHVAIHVLAVGRMAIFEKGGGVEDALNIRDLLRAVYQAAVEHYR
jgi:short-subunit dehydrogenase